MSERPEKPTQEQVTQAMELLAPAPDLVTTAKAQVDAWFEMRAYVLGKIQEILVPGVDYTVITMWDKKAQREVEKRSLGKAGAEKLAALPMFEFKAKFEWDEETSAAALAAGQKGWLCYWCDLYRPDGTYVGRGGGARNIAKDAGDLNKTRKMAQKSAYVDAVIRACGISDVVTQDLEDMPGRHQEAQKGPSEPLTTPTPTQDTPKAATAPQKAAAEVVPLKSKEEPPKRGWIPPFEWLEHLDDLMGRLKPEERQKASDWLYDPSHRNPPDWFRMTAKLRKKLAHETLPPLPECVASGGIEALNDDEVPKG